MNEVTISGRFDRIIETRSTNQGELILIIHVKGKTQDYAVRVTGPFVNGLRILWPDQYEVTVSGSLSGLAYNNLPEIVAKSVAFHV